MKKEEKLIFDTFYKKKVAQFAAKVSSIDDTPVVNDEENGEKRKRNDEDVPIDCLNCHDGKFSIDYAPEDDDYPWKCECGKKWKESAVLDEKLTETKVENLVFYWDADGEVDATTSCSAGEAMCSFIAKKCKEANNYSVEFIKKLAKEVFEDTEEEEESESEEDVM